MDSSLFDLFKRKEILILGFGKEGRSTLKFLKKYTEYYKLAVADKNPYIKIIDPGLKGNNISFFFGEDYLKRINQYDIIIKSPGISVRQLENRVDVSKITSQTELFLSVYRDQIIGITGTKGKSTTSSLIYSILERANKNVLLVGNIGIPPLNYYDQVTEDSIIIYEMSAHQLEGIQVSPHISVFLNIFEEHLDHYQKMDQYKSAKYNIFKYQKRGDWIIFNRENPKIYKEINALCPASGKVLFPAWKGDAHGVYLIAEDKIQINIENQSQVYNFNNRIGIPGFHNMKNIMASVGVSALFNVDQAVIQKTVNSFKGLEHRLEYVGKIKGIHFYNDSIATVPEATIEAVKTLKKVDLLILGGLDRGINYEALVEYLSTGPVDKIVLTGTVGNRLRSMLLSRITEKRLFSIRSFDALPELIRKHIPQNGICLLSPAAASYEMFENFEERGKVFKEMIKNL